VFQRPKFVCKLLIVRLPQALKFAEITALVPFSTAATKNLVVVQGRRLQAQDVEQVRQLIADHPEWSRQRISQELCVQWDWRNRAGQWKDMAAPPRRRQTPSHRMQTATVEPSHTLTKR
jgi:hypothetical protein